MLSHRFGWRPFTDFAHRGPCLEVVCWMGPSALDVCRLRHNLAPDRGAACAVIVVASESINAP